MAIVILALLLLGMLVVILRALPAAREKTRKAEETAGLPPRAPVLAADLGPAVRGVGRLTLRDAEHGLVGSPDLIIGNEVIERKRASASRRSHPDRPADGDLLQLAGYLFLCERDLQVGRPMVGRLQYLDTAGGILPGGDHRVELTGSLRERLVAALGTMRQAVDGLREVHRNHEAWGRCGGCRARGPCGEALEAPGA